MPRRSSMLEPQYKSGEVRLSANHIGLLHGLLDRPGGRAMTVKDFVNAALPYVPRFGGSGTWWSVVKSVRTFRGEWAEFRRAGRGISVRITPRGRAILTGEVPARIMGFGPYVGLPKPKAAAARVPLPLVLDVFAADPLDPPARPATVPPSDLPASELVWRPDGYAREITELARLTFSHQRGPTVRSFVAERVGRSYRLSVESFPAEDIRLMRRASCGPLSLGEVIALIDGAARPGADLSRLLRVESVVYPRLSAVYEGRMRMG